jgi:hypothetical protein
MNNKQIIRHELTKCMADPIHFMRKYCRIQHPKRGKIPFELYDFQEKSLDEIRRNRFNIILKSRQLGLSTLISAYVLWRMLFTDDQNILVIAIKATVAKNIITKIRVMYENLPLFLRNVKCSENNKMSLTFGNGSTVKAVPSTVDAGRSEALSLLIMDETAFIPGAEEIWTSAQQTLATGGDAILLSTPFGIGNLFHKMWVQAEEGTNGFNPIKLPWYLHPERDQEWRDKQTQQLGEKQAAQECDCIGGDSIVTLRHIETEDIIRVSMEYLYYMLPGNIIHNNIQYEILTNNGFEHFTGVKELEHDVYVTMELSNGLTLDCSLNHLLIDENNNQIEAIDVKVGDCLRGQTNTVMVTNISEVDSNIKLYDIINSGKDNLFFTQGILVHNCSFETSGNSVIELELLEEYRENMCEEPLEKIYVDRNLWRWEYPKSNYRYMVSADVARGDGTDYSTFQVINIETLEQVAEYRGKIGVKEFGNLLVNVATEYNDALLVIENVGVGLAVVQVAIDREYRNLYYSYRNDGYVDSNIQIANRYDMVDKSSKVPGFITSRKTRPLIISKLETYFRERIITVKSERLINELQTFIWNNNRAEARSGYNDDLTMAIAIGCFVRDTALRIHDEGIKYAKSTLRGVRSGKRNTSNSRDRSKEFDWLL